MRKSRKAMTLMLSFAAAFCLLTGCGNSADSGKTESNQQGNAAAGKENTENQKGAEAAGSYAVDQELEKVEVVYGNHPNNLYQKSNAPCFGDGRVYYIDLDYQICSCALDGSDFKVHGSTGELTFRSAPGWLNYYKGSVYYMVTLYAKDDTRTTEIRRLNLETNAPETVAVIDDGKVTTDNGMLIINDDLFYSTQEPQETISVGVLSLITGERNTIEVKSEETGNSEFVFDSDGTYVYMLWNSTSPCVTRLPLNQIYEEKPKQETLISRFMYTNGTIIDDGGIYTVYQDSDTHDNTYCFYDYKNAGEDWKYETLAEKIECSDFSNEEELIRNLIYYTLGYKLNGARVSLRYNSLSEAWLYYAPDMDYTKSVKAATVEFFVNGDRRSGSYIGEYEDKLYIVAEGEDGDVLHTLTADGVFQ